VIDARRAQFNFGDKLIADEVDGLYEEWMVHVDQVLADEKIVAAAYEALAKRRLLSRTRGRCAWLATRPAKSAPRHVRKAKTTIWWRPSSSMPRLPCRSPC
jgi:hypothetical protein